MPNVEKSLKTGTGKKPGLPVPLKPNPPPLDVPP